MVQAVFRPLQTNALLGFVLGQLCKSLAVVLRVISLKGCLPMCAAGHCGEG